MNRTEPVVPAVSAVRLAAVGCGVGLSALAVFAALHSLVVRPVWSQVAAAIPAVVVIGMAMAWTYDAFVCAAPHRSRAAGGARFGAMMWCAALPATALANVMRVHTHAAVPAWFDWTALVLAVGGGAAALWTATRSRRGAVLGAIAAVTLLAAAGGPLPILRSGRIAELWLGLLILEAIGGVLLSWMYRWWAAPAGSRD